LQEEEMMKKRRQKLELIAIVGLGIATFFNAFSAYQSSQHSGAMNYYYNQSTSLINQTSALSVVIQNLSSEDLTVYMRLVELEQDWKSAPEGSDAQRSAENTYMNFQMRFVREDLANAIAWSNEHYADTNEYLPPWQSPDYLKDYIEMLGELSAIVTQVESEGNKHNTLSDSLQLLTVFYTTVMFLLGICGTLKHWKHKIAVLVFSATLFAAATVMLSQQPFFPDAEKAFENIMSAFVEKYGQYTGR
jgi:hypothetical protein